MIDLRIEVVQESIYIGVCSTNWQWFLGKICLCGTFSLHLKSGGNEDDSTSMEIAYIDICIVSSKLL